MPPETLLLGRQTPAPAFNPGQATPIWAQHFQDLFPGVLPGQCHRWLLAAPEFRDPSLDDSRSSPSETHPLHICLCFISCIGEGNGNPLQYSCLENPRDGGAWWAAVSGVSQSRTRLKRLSSSSSISSLQSLPGLLLEIFLVWGPLQSDFALTCFSLLFH